MSHEDLNKVTPLWQILRMKLATRIMLVIAPSGDPLVTRQTFPAELG